METVQDAAKRAAIQAIAKNTERIAEALEKLNENLDALVGGIAGGGGVASPGYEPRPQRR